MEEKIKIRIVIEVLGSPKEYVEEVLNKIIAKLKNEFKVTDVKFYKAEEVKKLWSSFAEIELEVSNINKVMGLCFDYMPSSIEILEPHEFIVKEKDLMDLLNDLLARLHRYDMLIKNLKAENILLKRKR